ncbi:cation:proton antiporter [Tranquillimonas rosea]|uniref:cation:proton antiporter n=1 Tax=Tranquillimonas rosea TaxID=641238 RepID=UPI003BAAE7AB
MAVTDVAAAMSPVMAFAIVGALGVGSQWLAWRLRLPAIVLMLAAGVIAGPVLGVFDPERDIGPLTGPIISVAVAVILFEGGLTLNFRSLRDAAEGVKRLVFIGAPLGWLLSALALRWGAGLSWESSAVFGGIMIVTGPTVIAPMLRTSRLARRPAQLLQWEAIVNDPIGALAAVLAFEVVLVVRTAETPGTVIWELAMGIGLAVLFGLAAGFGLAWAFRRNKVPEFMKVPVLFAVLLAVFAISDTVLHESGLLAVTIIGIVMANADLPSYDEIRRFKEQATVLLVSGVFILLAASLDFSTLAQLDWRAAVFVALVVLIVRPVTVFLSLMSTSLPFKEKLLVALTGPRGVVLVAVAGLFGDRLFGLGVGDGALIGPLAFVLVAASVVVHGFTLAPFARLLGLTGAETPGVLIVGGSQFSTELAEALKEAEIPVLIADPNRGHLTAARKIGVPTFYGDILSEAAEYRVETAAYKIVVAATDNDAYNTLVATDLAPEFGRENVYQVAREKSDTTRHALPASLGGRRFGAGATYNNLNRKVWNGWEVRITGLTEEYGLKRWRRDNPDALMLAWIGRDTEIHFIGDADAPRDIPGRRIVSVAPPREAARAEAG